MTSFGLVYTNGYEIIAPCGHWASYPEHWHAFLELREIGIITIRINTHPIQELNNLIESRNH